MKFLTPSERAALSPEYLSTKIMCQLVEIYCACLPGQDMAAFHKEIYTQVLLAGLPGEEILQHCMATNDGKLSKYEAMLISCAYCIQGDRARHGKKTEVAWACMLEARFFLGYAKAAEVSEPRIDTIREMVMKEARTVEAQKNVGIREDVKHKAKEEAIRLVRKLGDEQGKCWEKFHEAAKDITVDLEKYLSSLPFQGKKRRSITEISRWLEEAPELRYLFTAEKPR